MRRHRAHGTYRTVHECLTAILNWGVTIKWIPVGHLDISDIKRAPDPRVGARRAGARGNLGAIPKEDIPDLDEVLLPLHRWVEEHHGRDGRILLDLLAFSGPRIGEALALHRDRLSRDEAGNGWASIEERAQKHVKGQAPPKHRRHRDMWIPAWLADDLETVTPNDDGYLFGAPQGSTWPVSRWARRRFDRWAAAYGWEELDDYCRHRGHDPTGCSGQNRRRWRFTPTTGAMQRRSGSSSSSGSIPRTSLTTSATATATRSTSCTSAPAPAAPAGPRPPWPSSGTHDGDRSARRTDARLLLRLVFRTSRTAFSGIYGLGL